MFSKGRTYDVYVLETGAGREGASEEKGGDDSQNSPQDTGRQGIHGVSIKYP